MGMLLSMPLFLFGVGLIIWARRRPPLPQRQMTDAMTPLEIDIRRRIAAAGPMPVGEYMALCLAHPQHGYYVTRDPLGASGDFTTAPEVSQMFGELIGLWMVTVWQQMGAPENVRVVELGPGRGTMMTDAMRAAKLVPDFSKAAALHLVEISPALQAMQQQTLADAGMSASLAQGARRGARPDRRSSSPTNSSTPCRSIRRCKMADGWHRRAVRIGADGALAYDRRAGAARAFRADPAAPRCAARVTARSSSGAPSSERWSSAGGSHASRRRAGHRLRPCRERDRRNAAGRCAIIFRRSAERAGRGRPHRACRFRGAGAHASNRWGRAFTGRSSKREFLRPARHRHPRRRHSKPTPIARQGA